MRRGKLNTFDHESPSRAPCARKKIIRWPCPMATTCGDDDGVRFQWQQIRMTAICNGNDSEGRPIAENRVSASREMQYVAHIWNYVWEAVKWNVKVLTIYKRYNWLTSLTLVYVWMFSNFILNVFEINVLDMDVFIFNGCSSRVTNCEVIWNASRIMFVNFWWCFGKVLSRWGDHIGYIKI